ncbi:hypothetical protein FB45DRAFT_758163, partial [Roridomyces roridus]
LPKGCFPCAPHRPGLAVDVRVLEFFRSLYLRIAPNKSAGIGALQDHLEKMGYQLASNDALVRQFGAALDWYTYLTHQAEAYIDQKLDSLRTSSETPDLPPPTPIIPETPQPAGTASGSRGSKRARADDDDKEPDPNHGKKARTKGPEKPKPENPFPEPPNLDRPSEYLRSRCPLCFGGNEWGTAV